MACFPSWRLTGFVSEACRLWERAVYITSVPAHSPRLKAITRYGLNKNTQTAGLRLFECSATSQGWLWRMFALFTVVKMLTLLHALCKTRPLLKYPQTTQHFLVTDESEKILRTESHLQLINIKRELFFSLH